MGLNLKDIVELAKAGYKVSEVKELIALASSEETNPANKEEGEQKGKGEKAEEHSEGKEQPDKAQQKPTSTPEEDSSILSYKKRVEELEEKLQKLQSDNVHKDQSDKQTKSDEELLNELTSSYM